MLFNWICVWLLLFGKEYQLVKGALKPPFQEARKAPFCISHQDNVWERIDPKYKKFKQYLEDTKLHFKNSSDNLFTISYTKLSLVYDKIRNAKDYIEGNKFMGDGDTLNQWMHIKVTTTEKNVIGILVQANRWPIGLPFGDFTSTKDRQSKPCAGDCKNDGVTNFAAIPCTYRPRDSLGHPNVYAYSGKETAEFHFNFKWPDVHCQRGNLMNFLVMLVTDTEAKIGMSDVQEFAKPMSNDGVAYPFYPDFCDALQCEGSSSPGLTPNKDLMKELKYNMEYDSCVLKFEENKKTCPPGPFKCPYVDQTRGDPNALLTKETDELKKIAEELHKPCACRQDVGIGAIDKETPPPDVKAPATIIWVDDSADVTEEYRAWERSPDEITAFDYTLPERIIPDKLLDNIAFTDADIVCSSTTRSVHGVFMIIAYAFFASVSFFVSRFDKDVLPGVGCCAKGMWVWCHALLAIFAMGFIFGGILVLFLLSASHFDGVLLQALHMPFGILAVLSFILLYVTAWIRPVSTGFRTKFILVHAILGYVSKLCAVISIIGILKEERKNSTFILVFFFVLELISIIFYGVGSLILQLTYKRMELKNRKRVCPFPEHQELEEPVPKNCANTRNAAFGGYLFVLFIVVLVGIIVYPGSILRSYFDIMRAPGNWPFQKVTTPEPMHS